MMDGAAGGFDCFPPLANFYREMDTRFVDRDPTIMFISYIELFIMGPACLYLAR